MKRQPKPVDPVAKVAALITGYAILANRVEKLENLQSVPAQTSSGGPLKDVDPYARKSAAGGEDQPAPAPLPDSSRWDKIHADVRQMAAETTGYSQADDPMCGNCRKRKRQHVRGIYCHGNDCNRVDKFRPIEVKDLLPGDSFKHRGLERIISSGWCVMDGSRKRFQDRDDTCYEHNVTDIRLAEEKAGEEGTATGPLCPQDTAPAKPKSSEPSAVVAQAGVLSATPAPPPTDTRTLAERMVFAFLECTNWKNHEFPIMIPVTLAPDDVENLSKAMRHALTACGIGEPVQLDDPGLVEAVARRLKSAWGCKDKSMLNVAEDILSGPVEENIQWAERDRRFARDCEAIAVKDRDAAHAELATARAIAQENCETAKAANEQRDAARAELATANAKLADIQKVSEARKNLALRAARERNAANATIADLKRTQGRLRSALRLCREDCISGSDNAIMIDKALASVAKVKK